MAAPPRLLTWAAPVMLVALFLVVLVGRGYPGNPVTWLQNKIGAGATLMKKIGDNVAPSVNVSTEQTTQTPIALTINLEQKNNQPSAAVSQAVTNTQQNSATALLTPTIASAAVITDTPTTLPTATPLPPTATPVPPTATTTPTLTPIATATSVAIASSPTAATAKVAVLLVPTATAPDSPANQQNEETPTATGIAAKSQTSNTTPTAKAATPTNTATALPATATPTLAPTPTDSTVAAKTYVIQPGDTLNLIANRFGTDNSSIMAANGLTTEDVYRLHPGQTLIIPTSNATDNANTKSGGQQTYTIQSGDTPIEIANAYGVSVAELLAANNLSAEDARNLRVGQVLVIPGDNQNNNQPSPTPTTPTSATVTAQPPTTTPAPQSKYRLDAPRLRSPENGNSVSCGSSSTLVWQGVPFMLDNDRFMLHLGFVNGRNASGTETVTWVLEQVQPSNNTAWNTDTSLCALAPQNLGRQWRWYVEVIDANHNAVSPPSTIWGFSWN
ncbi:MAG: LysM peptidoglycan-binding domain-containing protein [Caldilineaceae bacterium]